MVITPCIQLKPARVLFHIQSWPVTVLYAAPPACQDTHFVCRSPLVHLGDPCCGFYSEVQAVYCQERVITNTHSNRPDGPALVSSPIPI